MHSIGRVGSARNNNYNTRRRPCSVASRHCPGRPSEPASPSPRPGAPAQRCPAATGPRPQRPACTPRGRPAPALMDQYNDEGPPPRAHADRMDPTCTCEHIDGFRRAPTAFYPAHKRFSPIYSFARNSVRGGTSLRAPAGSFSKKNPKPTEKGPFTS